MINAVIIEENDNVAVAIEEIAKGSEISYKLKDNSVQTIVALDDITIYHKFAIKDMAQGEKVTKYGEHIGEANKEIKIGQHVHIHNVVSVREDLDKQVTATV